MCIFVPLLILQKKIFYYDALDEVLYQVDARYLSQIYIHGTSKLEDSKRTALQ